MNFVDNVLFYYDVKVVQQKSVQIRVKEVSKHLSIYIRFILLSPKYTKYIIINYFTQDVYMVVCQINK